MHRSTLILPIVFASIFILLGINLAYGRTDYNAMDRGLTEREMKPRGQAEGEERNTRERLRQIRIQESRMPRDIRNAATTFVTRPGSARPETIDYTSRERVKFIYGLGWPMGNEAKGWSYPAGYPLEFDATDPQAINISEERPIVEWWEMSERSRGQRAEFFRAKFGAVSELRASPQQMQGGGQIETGGAGAAQPSGSQGVRPLDLGQPSSGGSKSTTPFTP